MKKNVLFFIIIIFLLSGCGQKFSPDTPVDNDGYFYQNKDLGFNLSLPPEFEYYQTQRKNGGEYIDLEIYVPTPDVNYHQEVPGYAKAIITRVFNKDYWESGVSGDTFELVGENSSRVYTVKFWQEPPRDWLPKWSEEMKQNIVDNFVIL